MTSSVTLTRHNLNPSSEQHECWTPNHRVTDVIDIKYAADVRECARKLDKDDDDFTHASFIESDNECSFSWEADSISDSTSVLISKEDLTPACLAPAPGSVFI